MKRILGAAALVTGLAVGIPAAVNATDKPVNTYMETAPRRLVQRERMVAGEVLTVSVPNPLASAVAVNITAAEPQADGYLTAWGDGTIPDVSNVNFEAGHNESNFAVVPVTQGTFHVYAYAETNLIIDLFGTYQPVFAKTARPCPVADGPVTISGQEGTITNDRSEAVLVNVSAGPSMYPLLPAGTHLEPGQSITVSYSVNEPVMVYFNGIYVGSFTPC